jgi:hypothetical protein
LSSVDDGGQSKRAKQRAKKRAEKLAKGEKDDNGVDDAEEEEEEVKDKLKLLVGSTASLTLKTETAVSKTSDEKESDASKELTKELRAIEKKLKAIAELEQRDSTTLNPDQVAKISMKKDLEEQKKRFEKSVS